MIARLQANYPVNNGDKQTIDIIMTYILPGSLITFSKND